LRGDPQDLARGVGEDVDRAIGTDHRCVRPTFGGEQDFLVLHALAVEGEQAQLARRQPGDQGLALPQRELVAPIEGQARYADRGPPEPGRLLDALAATVGSEHGAVVVDAVRDHRPAVVAPATHDVQLVAAARAVFGGPQAAGARLERQSLRIAVAEAVDAGKRIGAAAERVVVGNAAVAGDAVDLAVGATGLARQFRGAAV